MRRARRGVMSVFALAIAGFVATIAVVLTVAISTHAKEQRLREAQVRAELHARSGLERGWDRLLESVEPFTEEWSPEADVKLRVVLERTENQFLVTSTAEVLGTSPRPVMKSLKRRATRTIEGKTIRIVLNAE